MKLILPLCALASIALGALATISALVWEDTQLAIGAVIAASVLAGVSILGELLRKALESKAVTQ